MMLLSWSSRKDNFLASKVLDRVAKKAILLSHNNETNKKKREKMNARERRLTNMVQRWDELRDIGYGNDYDKARFFADERNRYARGSADRNRAGDIQFKEDVDANLIGISGNKAMQFVKLVRTRAFQNRRIWETLGGYGSILYLAGLDCTAEQRRAVMSEAATRVRSTGQAISKGILRGIVQDHGITSTRGRPSQTQMEQKRNILARFIFEEYDEVPDEVAAAMPHDLAAQFA